MSELITTAKKGVEECYFKHHIKLITPVKQKEGKNTFLVDKNVLFQLHQWKAVNKTVIRKGEECEIEFAEYSPFIYNSLVRVYKFDKVLFHEEYKKDGEGEEVTLTPTRYWLEIVFDQVTLELELDIEKICPVYHPPQPKKRKRRKRKR